MRFAEFRAKCPAIKDVAYSKPQVELPCYDDGHMLFTKVGGAAPAEGDDTHVDVGRYDGLNERKAFQSNVPVEALDAWVLAELKRSSFEAALELAVILPESLGTQAALQEAALKIGIPFGDEMTEFLAWADREIDRADKDVDGELKPSESPTG